MSADSISGRVIENTFLETVCIMTHYEVGFSVLYLKNRNLTVRSKVMSNVKASG